jgi:hypothetical protein
VSRFRASFRTAIEVDFERDQPPGEELALYLQRELEAKLATSLDLDNYEDWGWCIGLETKPRRPWLILAYLETEVDWACNIESSFGWFARLRGRNDDHERARMAHALHEVLVADSRFSGIEWWKDRQGEGDPWATPTG